MRKQQQGVGLLEVLISLMLLAVAVLGYSAMQVKANNVSIEADNQTRAIELARDLHERMRVNREGMKAVFDKGVQGTYTGTANMTAAPDACRGKDCSPDALARFDFDTVKFQAQSLGMDINIHQCPQGTTVEQRHCIYIAWGNTTPTVGATATDCTNNQNIYHPNAQCVFMESFSYAK